MSEIKKVTEVEEVAIATDATALAEEAAAAEAAAPVETVATDTPVSAYDPELLALIKKYGGDESVLDKLEAEYGVGNVSDLTMLKEDELAKAGLKLVKVRLMMKDLQNEAKEAAAAAAAPATPVASISAMSAMAALPPVSSDESLLEKLRVDGMLKVDDSSYQAALRVYLAGKEGIFSVRKKLLERMVAQSKKINEPVNPLYYKIKKMVTKHDYADLFNAIDGLDSSYVTQANCDEFLNRVEHELLPVIFDCYDAVFAWVEGYNGDVMNIANIIRGAGTSLVNCPPVDPVLGASESLKNAINSTFRGTFLPIAGAMAKDAMDIGKLLENPALPNLVGCENKDVMLQDLGLNVTANVTRCEKALVQFVLGLAKFETESVGNEIDYILALYYVGRNIPWSKLGHNTTAARGAGVTAIGGNNML